MKAKTYFIISGLIFAIIALLHLSRILSNWNFEFGSYSFPMWASYIPVIFLGVLSVLGFRFAMKTD